MGQDSPAVTSRKRFRPVLASSGSVLACKTPPRSPRTGAYGSCGRYARRRQSRSPAGTRSCCYGGAGWGWGVQEGLTLVYVRTALRPAGCPSVQLEASRPCHNVAL